MKSYRLFLVLSAILLSAFCTPASAERIVCLINNSSYAIKMEGTGDGAATIEYEAHGGDKNRCWHVSASLHSLEFVRNYTKNSAGKWQNAGITGFHFTDPIIIRSGWGYFQPAYNTPYGSQPAMWQVWQANIENKLCGKVICVYYHNDPDVQRLFVVDKK